METLYDMHCHLGFVPDPLAAAQAGAAAGIGAFSCTVTPAEYERLQPLLAPVPGVAVGLGAHPWWIVDGRVGEAELDTFCALAPATRFIGEIGLDFAGPRNTAESRTRQVAVFERILSACDAPLVLVSSAQSSLASSKASPTKDESDADVRASDVGSLASVNNPAPDGDQADKLISIHAVQSTGTVLDLLEAHGTCERHRCIFHWFSGTSDELARARDLGCFFSVGPRMLASRRGREYARQIPLDRLLLETDMPSREGETLPASVWHAELNNALTGIAQLKNVDRDALAAQLAATSAVLLGR